MNKKAVKKGLLPYLFIGIFMLGVLFFFNMANQKVNVLTYDAFMKEIKDKNVKEILVDRRKLSISATLLRGYILINDKKEYMKYVPKEIIPEFDRIRRELLKSDIYSLILEEMGENLNIENFKKIYNIYEKEDKKIKMSNI